MLVIELRGCVIEGTYTRCFNKGVGLPVLVVWVPRLTGPFGASARR